MFQHSARRGLPSLGPQPPLSLSGLEAAWGRHLERHGHAGEASTGKLAPHTALRYSFTEWPFIKCLLRSRLDDLDTTANNITMIPALVMLAAKWKTETNAPGVQPSVTFSPLVQFTLNLCCITYHFYNLGV